MTGVHIGHDCVIEDNVILCANVILAGFTTIMNNVNMGLGSITYQFTVIAPYCMINANIFIKENVLPFSLYKSFNW